jgi:hypothetical protein
MLPHERSLVERFTNRPFALLGINSDPNRQEVEQRLPQEQVSWRSWWDSSPDGPIARRWRVNAWPAFFLVDAKGTIRYKSDTLRTPEQIDKAVAKLLNERNAEKAASAPPVSPGS